MTYGTPLPRRPGRNHLQDGRSRQSSVLFFFGFFIFRDTICARLKRRMPGQSAERETMRPFCVRWKRTGSGGGGGGSYLLLSLLGAATRRVVIEARIELCNGARVLFLTPEADRRMKIRRDPRWKRIHLIDRALPLRTSLRNDERRNSRNYSHYRSRTYLVIDRVRSIR